MLGAGGQLMTEQTTARTTNKRRSRRAPPKGTTKVRAYKGPMGLGPNLAVAILDVSETGLRLVLRSDLPKGQEIEVNLDNVSTKPIKVIADVIWSLPMADGNFCVGVSFQKPLRY